MAKERAARGARLTTVVVICPRECIPAEKVFDLRSYVSHVECRADDGSHKLGTIPGVVDKLDDSYL